MAFYNYLRKTVLLCTLLLIVQISAVFAQDPRNPWWDGCTSILVGAKASVDGSTMTSHSCDSNTDRTWINIVPRKKHEKGSMAPVYYQPKRTRSANDPDVLQAGEIPQVAETYAYINTAYPVMNEYQLAIGETTTGGRRELHSSDGILDAPELYRFALERAKTAREAISIIDELTKKYGYNDYGECFTFADKNEVWVLEILGPGKGKIGAVWAAQRVPDDEVFVSANSIRIRQIDLKNKDYFMASDNVFSLAKERGWWNPDSGEPFEFCYAYGPKTRTNLYCRRREWRVLSLIASSLKLNPESENYPFSVKPDKKLSVADVRAIFRDTYAGTYYDMTRTLYSQNRRGEFKKNPHANPFMSSDMRALLKIPRERMIACERATYVQITQSRSWLPDHIGGVVWLGYDNPAVTPHIPFYCGNLQMPESYEIDGRREYRTDCAWWTFRRVAKLCTFRWQDMSPVAVGVAQEVEKNLYSNIESVEKTARDLYKKNPEEARKFLTEYSIKMANQTVERYLKLGDELWAEFNTRF